jgi:hypothetical protein
MTPQVSTKSAGGSAPFTGRQGSERGRKRAGDVAVTASVTYISD